MELPGKTITYDPTREDTNKACTNRAEIRGHAFVSGSEKGESAGKTGQRSSLLGIQNVDGPQSLES